nr:MucB/RseB C-terminal domain-containing protein [uncultured Albidiferax sp.]
MHVRTYPALLAVLCAAMLLPLAQAQQAVRAQPVASSSEPVVAERTVSEWLMRMHEASRKRTYVGTFVVSSGTGSLSSARIWHACDGAQQMERVESLTGAPRSIFRRNDQVITFLPDSKVAVTETRESLGLFPNLLQTGDSAIPMFYGAKQVGSDRVAGFDADVVVLRPKDSLRYGYRIWSEKKSGLVVKLQTLDADGRVLEQAAFSELQLDAPVKMEKLGQMMANTAGYRVETSAMVKTTALSEGWVLKNGVPGFQPMSCFRRSVGTGTAADGTVQWVFSDGLASVSLFVEAFESQRHLQEGSTAMGATQSLTRRIGDWWLTAVGEVPQATLKAFAHGLERKK